MILGKILAGLAALLSLILSEISLIWHYGLPGWGTLLFFFLFFAVWFGSAFFAATVAELFRQKVTKHFFLGLLLPYVYPLWLAQHIQMGEERAVAEAEAAEEAATEARRSEMAERFSAMQAGREARRRNRIAATQGIDPSEVPEDVVKMEAEAAPTVIPAVAPAVPEAAPDSPIKAYLQEQPVDGEGSRPGPFVLELGNGGGTVLIDAVRSMQDDFMICVVAGTGKTVRVKYQNVESVSRADA